MCCRKYDADLKKAFEQLRRVVPRLPRSYSRVSGYLISKFLQNILFTFLFVLIRPLRDFYKFPSLRDNSPPNIAPRLYGQNCEFFTTQLSRNSQETWAQRKLNHLYVMARTAKASESLVRILMYGTWAIVSQFSISWFFKKDVRYKCYQLKQLNNVCVHFAGTNFTGSHQIHREPGKENWRYGEGVKLQLCLATRTHLGRQCPDERAFRVWPHVPSIPTAFFAFHAVEAVYSTSFSTFN